MKIEMSPFRQPLRNEAFKPMMRKGYLSKEHGPLREIMLHKYLISTISLGINFFPTVLSKKFS
jgi:hypothetical protein